MAACFNEYVIFLMKRISNKKKKVETCNLKDQEDFFFVI